MPDWLTVALAAQGMVLVVAGAVLFGAGLTVHHHVTPVAGLGPWEIMPLSAQVIGACLLALGLAAGLAIAGGDLQRLRIPGADDGDRRVRLVGGPARRDGRRLVASTSPGTPRPRGVRRGRGAYRAVGSRADAEAGWLTGG